MYRTWSLLSLAALGASLAIACGGGDDATDPNANESPLNAIFGNEADLRAEELLVQEKVRDCMTALGFQYTPLDLSAQGAIQTIDTESDEWVKEHGFGISTFADGPAFTGGGAITITDPNQSYLQSLSESDRTAYQKALFGDIPTFSPESSTSSSSSDGGPVVVNIGGGGAGDSGCIGKANREVRGDRPVFDQDFQQKLEELHDRIDADARVVKAKRAWSTCLAKSGYQYADLEAIQEDLRSRTKAITGQDPGVGIGGGTIVRVGGGISIGDSSAAPKPTPTPAYDTSALRQLQTEEKKLALAALECKKKEIDAVLNEVRTEYEKAFVAENPDLVRGKSGK